MHVVRNSTTQGPCKRPLSEKTPVRPFQGLRVFVGRLHLPGVEIPEVSASFLPEPQGLDLTANERCSDGKDHLLQASLGCTSNNDMMYALGWLLCLHYAVITATFQERGEIPAAAGISTPERTIWTCTLGPSRAVSLESMTCCQLLLVCQFPDSPRRRSQRQYTTIQPRAIDMDSLIDQHQVAGIRFGAF